MSEVEKAPTSITGVVITLNEADRIERCLISMRALCSELIVVDAGSSDDTCARATAVGARVIHQPWLGFAAQKNLAIAAAQTPWVLLLDADEWLAEGADTQIRNALQRSNDVDVYRLKRRTHFLGCVMNFGSFGREPVQRVFRADVRYAEAKVHEYLDLRGKKLANCPALIEHDTARNAEEYWAKLQRYTELWAEEQRAHGKYAWPGRGTLAAAAYLLKNLVLRLGVLDGPHAWHFHLLHARYVALKYRLLANRQHRTLIS